MPATPAALIDDGLVAPCVHCGAPQQPIRLVEQARSCAYCHAPDPLDHAARARVAAAARALAATKNDHQLPDEMIASAGDLGWLTFALVGGCILVSGGIALLWVGSSLPNGIGFVAFLRTGHAQGLDAIDTTAYWWLLFSILTLTVACLPWVSAGQLWVYLLVRDLRALPPLSAGGAARCHLCGDDLKGAGVVRRCKSCRADNLVDGARFRAAAKTLADAIAAMGKSTKKRVGRRIGWIETGLMWAAGLPFACLLIVPPLSFAFDGPHPELVPILPVLVALAVVLRLLAVIARPARGQ